MTESSRLVPVHLLALPVRLAATSQQHFEELMREFTLITANTPHADADRHVPTRLMNLVAALVQQFGTVTSDADRRLSEAIDRGDEIIDDHLIEIPVEAGPASIVLGELIDEADEYCRAGQHLLTLESPPDCVAYRHWYLGQILAQLQGEPPTPWPHSDEAATPS